MNHMSPFIDTKDNTGFAVFFVFVLTTPIISKRHSFGGHILVIATFFVGISSLEQF